MSAFALDRLSLHTIRLPFRRAFKHNAANRDSTEAVLARVVTNEGIVGWGECLPRTYVTGETIASVKRSIEDILWPRLVAIQTDDIAEAANAIAELPETQPADNGNEPTPITSARAAVELAALDALSRQMRFRLDELPARLGIAARAAPSDVRYSGVIGQYPTPKTLLRQAQMGVYGQKDIKVKVAGWDSTTQKRLRLLARARRVYGQRLRVDANNAWRLDDAMDAVARLAEWGYTAIEEPLQPRGDRSILDDRWQTLTEHANACGIAILADEAYVTRSDLDRIIANHAASGINARVSKNGGLIATMRGLRAAANANLAIQLGCMVGETSLLSAAGRWILQSQPHVHYAEGCYGTWLLESDITSEPLHFGYGGTWKPLSGFGLGVRVDDAAIEARRTAAPLELNRRDVET